VLKRLGKLAWWRRPKTAEELQALADDRSAAADSEQIHASSPGINPGQQPR
jgi:hypothetical protein